MSARTGIEWTDATWNPVVGCTKVSQGCKHCYAKTLHDRRHKAYNAGKALPLQYAQPFERVQFIGQRLHQPLRWRAPRRVFVNALSDVFHEQLSIDRIAAIWAVMALAPRHTFQVLTKRPARMREVLTDPRFYGHVLYQADTIRLVRPELGMIGISDPARFPLPNVWLGTSVENQAAADERIPELLRTPAALRFLSCEPLLGAVDLRCHLWHGFDHRPLHWVIVGGESGSGARPLDIRWAQSIVAQCRAAGVASFVKQLGAVPMEPEADWRGRPTTRLLSAKNRDRVPDGFVPLATGDAKGGDESYWPLELRVREFPAQAGVV